MSNARSFVPIVVFASIIILIFGGSLFLLTAGKGIGQFLFGRWYAESELKDYVASVSKAEVAGASCQAVDTDSNGYVSCDYTTNQEPGVTRSLDCAAWGIEGIVNRGCKTRLPNFSNGQGP